MKAVHAGTLGLAMLLAAVATIAGNSASAPAPPSPTPGSAAGGSGAPRLTSHEKAQRIRDLPEEERRWLTDYVAPIILPDEQNLFLQLTEDYQRQIFKGEFWSRREREGLRAPLGPGYQARYGHLREIAAEEYEGVNSDAGRMVVRLGEPASIEELMSCSEVYRQAEIWSYPNGSSSGSREIQHLFYRPGFGASRRLWLPGDRGIFQTASCLASFDQACAITATGAPPRASGEFCPGMAVPKSCQAACAVARIAQEIQGRGVQEGSLIEQAPAVSTEGLEGLWQRLASVSNSAARPIAVENAPALSQSAPAGEPPRGWSNEEIRERILALPKKYREWLDLAGPLLSEGELVAFLGLPSGERDGYIRKFWRRHGHVK